MTIGDVEKSCTSFGELLRRLRQAARLTQEELGLAIGYSRAHVARLESNQRAPDPVAVRARFIEALGLQDEHGLAARLVGLAEAAHEGTAIAPQQQCVLTNLPVQLTSFIGRERELAELRGVLPETRLMTLTGSGGVGKTRLALQLAAGAMQDFPDGIWLVELSPIAAEGLVAHSVATVLGVREEPRRPILATLADYLRDKRLLLILDNCEHVIQASAQLAEALLKASPGMRILATSREALGTPGERAWRVPSLQIPEPGADLGVVALAGYEAVHLFVERAILVQHGWGLTAVNAPAVQRICARLDGIPLAIELAAVRMKSLAAEEIAERLDDRFRLLTGGSRTALPRQQTLRGAIDWSYRLLSDAERLLLRRLAVFSGGWVLAAAESVCAGDGLAAPDVLDVLTHLIDKSLVVAHADDNSPVTRYRLLETIRQYAMEKLMDAEEGAQVRDSHLDYYIKMGETEMPGFFTSPNQAGVVERVARDFDNIRRAMDWAIETGKVEAGLRLAHAWFVLYMVRGAQRELLARIERMLALPVQQPNTRMRALVYIDLANVYARQAEYEQLRKRLEHIQAIGQALDDLEIQANVVGFEAFLAQMDGDYARAHACLEQYWTMARVGKWMSDVELKAGELANRGFLALAEGDYPQSKRYFTEALAHMADSDKMDSSATERHMGYALVYLGELDAAALRLRHSLVDNHAMGDKVAVAACVGAYGVLALAQANLLRAARLFGASEGISQSIHTPLMTTDTVQIQRNVTALRARLDETALNAAWAEGQAMTLQQAVDYAML